MVEDKEILEVEQEEYKRHSLQIIIV